jgi:hypothetical protein
MMKNTFDKTKERSQTTAASNNNVFEKMSIPDGGAENKAAIDKQKRAKK